MTCPCGAALTGRQRAYCSAACKQRAHRAVLREREERRAAERERQGIVRVSFDIDAKALIAAGLVGDMRGMTLDQALRKALYAGLALERDALRAPHEPSAAERAQPITERTNR